MLRIAGCYRAALCSFLARYQQLRLGMLLELRRGHVSYDNLIRLTHSTVEFDRICLCCMKLRKVHSRPTFTLRSVTIVNFTFDI